MEERGNEVNETELKMGKVTEGFGPKSEIGVSF